MLSIWRGEDRSREPLVEMGVMEGHSPGITSAATGDMCCIRVARGSRGGGGVQGFCLELAPFSAFPHTDCMNALRSWLSVCIVVSAPPPLPLGFFFLLFIHLEDLLY